MQTQEKSMKYSHQIGIPYTSFSQHGCSNMHFILVVYLNLQIYDTIRQAILVQTCFTWHCFCTWNVQMYMM